MNIKEIRRKNGIKQVELAKASSIYPSMLSSIECGWIKLSTDLRSRIRAGFQKLGVENPFDVS